MVGQHFGKIAHIDVGRADWAIAEMIEVWFSDAIGRLLNWMTDLALGLLAG